MESCLTMKTINYKKIVSSISDISNTFSIGVSGGVDSIVLLDILRKNDFNIQVLHFNHKIRNNSDEDEKLVIDYCEKYSLKYKIGYGKNLCGNNLEMKAREQRWEFLEKSTKNFSNLIITAHHLNDLVENYVMGIIRGNNLKSCVMPQKTITENGFIRFKPLLKDVLKEQLYNFAVKRNLQWNEDLTNNDNNMLRNHVRNIIIPEMLKSHNVFKTIPNLIDEIEQMV